MMAFNPNTGIQFESGSGWAGYFSKRHAIKLLRPGGLRCERCCHVGSIASPPLANQAIR